MDLPPNATPNVNEVAVFGRSFHLSGLVPVPKVVLFLSRVTFTDSCWVWNGSLRNRMQAYGHFNYQHKAMTSHRFAWLALVGELPVGKHLHHLCENPACVNPAHLLPLDPTVHMREYTPQNAVVQRGASSTCPNGHDLSGHNLIVRGDGRRRCRTCLHAYEVKRREAMRLANVKPEPTHCANGHEWTDENTYVYLGRRQCRRCHADLTNRQYHEKREGVPSKHKKDWTHCINGHEFTPENTLTYNGRRRCKTCVREKSKETWEKIKAERGPKTHCKNGHPWVPENIIYHNQRGRMQSICKTCREAQAAKAYANHKAKHGKA
jgi:hypothetical protein